MISLRPLQANDFELLVIWENLPELWRVSEQQGPFEKEEIREFAENCLDPANLSIERWLICLSDEPIGAVDFFDYDQQNNQCGLGIFIAYPENRNKGHASIALHMALELLALRQCSLVRVIIYDSNTISKLLFLRAGFEEGGHLYYKGKSAQQFIWTN